MSNTDNEMREYEVFLIHETDKAILVSEDEEQESTVWIPKSQIMENVWDGIEAGDLIIITVPEWLAIEKGLE